MLKQRLLLAHWAGLVANLWGDGDGAAPVLTPLYGEYDLNFRAEDTTGAPSVVKVMRAGCQPEDIRFQTAMIHALQSVEGVPVPQILPTAGGDLIAGGADEHGEERLIWRLALLPGTTLDQHRLTEGLIAEIGDMIARMHAALADFSDPALERSFKWDLCAADWISPHLSLFDGEPALKRQLVSLLDWYESAGRAALSALPRQPIHNDLNLHNLLAVSGRGRGRGSRACWISAMRYSTPGSVIWPSPGPIWPAARSGPSRPWRRWSRAIPGTLP